MGKYIYMMFPRHHSEVNRHFKFVTNLVTNYILLIIKLIPSLGILDVGNGKAGLTGSGMMYWGMMAGFITTVFVLAVLLDQPRRAAWNYLRRHLTILGN